MAWKRRNKDSSKIIFPLELPQGEYMITDESEAPFFFGNSKRIKKKPLIFDSFNRENSNNLGVADTGQSWSSLGNLRIANNAAQVVSTGSELIEIDIQNYIVSVDFVVPNDVMALTFRSINADNTMRINFHNSSGNLFLAKRVNGVTTNLANLGTYIQGDNIKAKILNNEITAYVNGIQKAKVIETYNENIKTVGIASTSTLQFGGKFDNFKVERL